MALFMGITRDSLIRKTTGVAPPVGDDTTCRTHHGWVIYSVVTDEHRVDVSTIEDASAVGIARFHHRPISQRVLHGSICKVHFGTRRPFSHTTTETATCASAANAWASLAGLEQAIEKGNRDGFEGTVAIRAILLLRTQSIAQHRWHPLDLSRRRVGAHERFYDFVKGTPQRAGTPRWVHRPKSNVDGFSKNSATTDSIRGESCRSPAKND